ncbi:hypothetical protein EMPG_11384 [Blastomyces silverae]|uniref:Helicase ATP-binding domain-containing protein n=1 Tax=Blastomyces silverae TaxID=2060906 RepID=A0A0H1BRQ7_9EURO|nr:hypothetical protein EMPG_11384 [Blastomyces silverae]
MVGNVASRKAEMCGKLFSTLLCQVLDFLGAKCRVKFEDLQNSDQASCDFVDNMVSYVEAEEMVSYVEAGEKTSEKLKLNQELVKKYQETSALELKYLDLCRCLGLDHLDPTVKLDNGRKITLMAWQVQGIDFILAREKKNIGGGGLVDGCGLGKTIQMLMAIYMAVTISEITKPILILCPANIIHVWVAEWRCFFSGALHLKIYHRTRDNIGDLIKKDLIIDPDEMASFLDELRNTPAIAAKMVIVSSYATWSQRTQMEVSDVPSSSRHSNSKKTCKYLEAFDWLVLDEAHHVKSISAETHSIVQSMVYKHIWFNTATPALNKVTDLVGYLNLVWQKEWSQFLPASASVDKEISEDEEESGDDEQAHKTQFDSEFIREEFCNAVISEDNISVQLLSPSIFKSLLVKGEMLIGDVFEVVSKILKILFLK